ncbi:hypothetical protein [Thermomonas sp.]|uniref:hypothetical protein n=1 Tax=Thermomonas sp. TaxID=1971895 RepID=UPI0024895C57|nr:hypothetical protein [Thermomonas sp.]MDI1252304.1 hypothetical protein [Thermomonas sp.]
MKVEVIPVWKKVTPVLGEELMAFWRSNKAIVDDAAAAMRATQAVCIARDESGAICGVGTAVIKVLPRLRQPMYYYRQFFAKSMRGRSQLIPFYQQARQALQEYNASLDKPESLGVLIETENAKLSSAYNHAYEPAFAATFIGYSPRGTHLYVSYFDGAALQPPKPLNAPVSAARAANAPGNQATLRRTSGRS